MENADNTQGEGGLENGVKGKVVARLWGGTDKAVELQVNDIVRLA
jgi:hypothetical protein